MTIEAVEKQEYRYQPTDEQGAPIGGEQVIKYTDADDLAKQLTEQNIHLRRQSRRLELERASRTRPAEAVLAGAKRRPAPKPITAAERLQLTKDLADPAKVVEAMTRLNGNAAPAMTVTEWRAEGLLFVERHPEYYNSKENNVALTNWVQAQNLEPYVENLELAYEQLKPTGLLAERPIAAKETPDEDADRAAGEAGRIASATEEPTKQPARSSSAMGRHNSSPAGSVVTPPKRAITRAEVNRMPSAEVVRRIETDPEFRRQLDALPPE